MAICPSCNASHASTKRHYCKNCFDNLSLSDQSKHTKQVANDHQQHRQQQHQVHLQQSNECTTAPTTHIAGISLEEIQSMSPLSSENLNEPLTAGMMLKIFSEVIKPINDRLDNHEARITALEQSTSSNSISLNEVKNTSTDNTQKLLASDARIKNLEQAQAKLKSVVTKQQTKIAIEDKKSRSRNLVFAGLSETESLVGATTDKDKVKYILDTIDLSHINICSCRRTGNKDKGPQDRPRFLIVEFPDQHSRNAVRSAASQLNSIASLKEIRIKADLNKAERDEYKRIYDLRDKLRTENPDATVEVTKGSVIMNGSEIDKFKSPTTDF